MTSYNPLELTSQNLAFKASAMKSYKQQKALMASVACLADASTMPKDIRTKLLAVIGNGDEKAYRQLRLEAKLSTISMDQQMLALQSAPLAHKRKLLDALPIIPVPVGAAFLGVAEADLYYLNSQNCGLFGDIYLRRRCNSMNELLLITENPGWLRYRPDGCPALMVPDSTMLYMLTYVDIWTAIAYTNMSWAEMKKQVEPTGRYYRYERTYRVSDLEEIRVAKLKS